MIKAIETFFILTSWLLLIISFVLLVWSAGGNYGLDNITCPKTVIKVGLDCNEISVQVSGGLQKIVDNRVNIFGFIISESTHVLFLMAFCGFCSTFFIRLFIRGLRQRRRRILGVFADVPGFSPVEADNFENF